jgi:hypothetical protein
LQRTPENVPVEPVLNPVTSGVTLADYFLGTSYLHTSISELCDSPISIINHVLSHQKVVRYSVDSNALNDSVDLIPALGTFTLLRGVHDAKLDLVVKARARGVCENDLGGGNDSPNGCRSASNGTASTCSRDKRVQLSASLTDNLRSSTVEMRVIVGRVFELVGKEAAGTPVNRFAVCGGVLAIDVVRCRLSRDENVGRLGVLRQVDIAEFMSPATSEVLAC